MTALKQYKRLECSGLWRDATGGQRREVVISLGDATLVISDGKADRALAHWSLPAVERVNPGLTPARFAPGPDSVEEVEIDDDEMVAALSRVHALIEARKPHPGRLRAALLVAGTGLAVLAGLIWVPGAVIDHTARVVPPETRTEIGQALMTDVFRVTGAACTAPEGRQALARLGERLFAPEPVNLIVLGTGLAGTRHLPGGTVLIGRGLVENSAAPEVLAGYILAEKARMQASDPLHDLLDWAGMRAAVGLLTTGALNPDRTVGYAEVLLTRPESQPDATLLATAFAEAGTDPGPYVQMAALPDRDRQALSEAMQGVALSPPMSDTDWVALQGICGG